MWKAAAGQINIPDQDNNDDDWETDPDFVNEVSEQEQRWGASTVEGSGRTAGSIDMEKLRRETEAADSEKKKKALIDGPNASFGYGGKFGVEKDRMDKTALGHDHIEKLQKHASQKDYSTGFGGKYGVQTDRVDKCAVNWDHKEKLEKHTSQKDYASGFGGKFGVQTDRQDKAAVGWDHVEKVDKHESQKDYSVGFGGKFGVQTDRQDKSAVGWDHHEAPQKHESQLDHKKGFGGKFGVQTDRMDKSAATFDDEPVKVGTVYNKVKPDIGSAKPSEMRAKFETMSSQDDSQTSSVVNSPVPRKNIHAKAALFNKQEDSMPPSPEHVVRKQIDQSKTAFLTQTSQQEGAHVENTPKQLDKNKLTQFAEQNQNNETNSSNKIKEELEELKMLQKQKMEEELKDDVYEDVQTREEETKKEQYQPERTEQNLEDEIEDTGLTAVALYDYQAGADDEISFDPEDIITHVERIDEGWWRGLCKGRYGLFPANYVQLQE